MQTCFSGTHEPLLLLANREDIRQAHLDSTVYSDVLTKLNRTVALDFDVSQGKLYWADVIDNAIYSTNMFGSHPRKVHVCHFLRS